MSDATHAEQERARAVVDRWCDRHGIGFVGTTLIEAQGKDLRDSIATALAEQWKEARQDELERCEIQVRVAMEFCYRCGGGLITDDVAPYCEFTCDEHDGDEPPKMLDHVLAALRRGDG